MCNNIKEGDSRLSDLLCVGYECCQCRYSYGLQV